MLDTTIPCPETAHGPCESRRLERPRYFPRQLVTPDEMNLEQAYFRDRMRRHNRLLHGWGVVCGAKVCAVPPDEEEAGNCHPCSDSKAWTVAVTPGYILGPYGDEIVIGSRVLVDLRTYCTPGPSDDCWSQTPDPWCSDVKRSEAECPVYVAVRYRETMTRPVRVPPPGCGCSDLDCDYSRWCDGYEICTLTECPASHHDPPGEQPRHLPHCPPCPDEPWVVLAKVDFDHNGCVTHIDNCSCRRLVMSFACYWWRCTPAESGMEERPDGSHAEHHIHHVGGGYYEVQGYEGRVRSKARAMEVARAVAGGRDPHGGAD